MVIKRPPIEVAQLVLLLSRATLSDSQRAIAERLCGQIVEWPLVVEISSEKFSAAWVHKHLATLGSPEVPADILTLLQRVARVFAMQSMRVVAELSAFHKAVIQPLDADYIYLKGPSLAAQFLDNLTDRYCRDIDVLVSECDHERVVRQAIALDYKVWPDSDREPLVLPARDLRALLRYEPSITLVSPSDVVIEVHRDIDKFSGLFDPADLLSDKREVRIVNMVAKTLPPEKLFCYICYHHSRHIWSRLHWLADLDAISTHPSFDLKATLRHADSLGLRPTVEACLEFNRLSGDPEAWESTPPDNRGMLMLNLCLDNLMGGLELEYALRSRFGMLGMPFRWMFDRRTAREMVRRHLYARLRPNFAQYQMYPLPERLQFCYYLTRPVTSLLRRLRLDGKTR